MESNDTSTLWEIKASLAKSISYNKIQGMVALTGAISAYLKSIASLLPITLAVYMSGMEAFSDLLILGLFGILFVWITQCYFSQM